MAEQKPVALDPRSLSARLWTYQAARFPVASQGALIVLFALACVCFGALTRAAPGAPPTPTLFVVLVVVFLLFFQLRVADEHRDYDEDLAARPELPVPSGVITLPELDIFFTGALAIQVVLTAALHPPLLALLVLPWLWIFLVRNDFFDRALLKRRPLLSLALHLVFFPLVALYAAAAGQLPETGLLSPALPVFLGLSAAAAMAMEFARKCRAKGDEREGVVTYSGLWGTVRAGMATASAVAAIVVFGALSFVATGVAGWWYLPATLAGFGAFLGAAGYADKPTPARANALLGWVAGATALTYFSVGVLPYLVREFFSAAV
ncbi:MAG: UbiA family prenyltransferase [Hyphomonadaceae bacterium]|nr:UbiA family prenyltransferase [Hyphomonadaceae bacterium]